MSLITTPEEEFIQELEGYLDTKFDKYSVSRIRTYLSNYKSSFPSQLMKEPEVIVRDRIVYRQLRTKDIQHKEVIVNNILPNQILNLITTATGLTLKQLTGKDRHVNIVLARHVAMYVIRDVCGETLKQVGQIFNRDHTTVLYSISHVIQMIEVENPAYLKLIGYCNFHLSVPEKATA